MIHYKAIVFLWRIFILKFKITSHRFAKTILTTDENFKQEWKDIEYAVNRITDKDIILNHKSKHPNNKSISVDLNDLIKEGLISRGWSPESSIFKEEGYTDDAWRLDFAKNGIAIEVAFNHGSVIAWNLLKPVLSSELNHVEKDIQTQIGIVITATAELKKSGGFDGAVGTYEKYVQYLKPLMNQLTVPIMIIGIESMENHCVIHEKNDRGSKYAVFLEKNTNKFNEENQDIYVKEEIETTIDFKE